MSLFPDRLRLPLDFDPQRLAADLAALSSVPWTAHFVQQNYEGEWSAIALRAPAGARHPIQMILSAPGCTDFIDTPFLTGAPYFQHVLGQFACPLLSVRLMRLAPGSIIKEHRDHDLSFEQGTVRVHVPVVTIRTSISASTAPAARCRRGPSGTSGCLTRTRSPTVGPPAGCTWSSMPS